MRNVRVVWAAAVWVVLMASSAGQATTSGISGVALLLGTPVGSTDNLYYWSGAYADATEDGIMVFDDQYDPTGAPWPNVSDMAAAANSGGALGMAMTQSGMVNFLSMATLNPGRSSAVGYSNLEQWVDFETSDPINVVGFSYATISQLETTTPEEIAYASFYAGFELNQWWDDGDGIRDEDEWHTLESGDFGDSWGLIDVDSIDETYADEYWFFPFGPGVYSVGVHAWAEAGVMTTVPVPGALALGLLGVALVRRFRRRG